MAVFIHNSCQWSICREIYFFVLCFMRFFVHDCKEPALWCMNLSAILPFWCKSWWFNCLCQCIWMRQTTALRCQLEDRISDANLSSICDAICLSFMLTCKQSLTMCLVFAMHFRWNVEWSIVMAVNAICRLSTSCVCCFDTRKLSCTSGNKNNVMQRQHNSCNCQASQNKPQSEF